jgi:hypothetical protein
VKTRHTYIAISALMLASSAALAGLENSEPVSVDAEARTAEGDMATARYSRNDVEYIGCGVEHTDLGGGDTFVLGFCEARDSSGETAVCTTFSPAMIQAIATISDTSHIRFIWNELFECVQIRVETNSQYLPDYVRRGM